MSSNLLSWFRGRVQAGQRRPGYRPRLERLEERLTPVQIEIVTNTAATALIQAGQASASGSWDSAGRRFDGDSTIEVDAEDFADPASGSLGFTQRGGQGSLVLGVGTLGSTSSRFEDGEGGRFSFEAGSGFNRGDPVRVKLLPGVDEDVGDPVHLRLLGEVTIRTTNADVAGHYTAGFRIDNETGRILVGSFAGAFQSTPITVMREARIGDTFEIDFRLEGTSTSSVVAVASADLALAIFATPVKVDLVGRTVAWDPKQGGLTFKYAVEEGDLPGEQKPQVELFWANGSTPIGNPIALPGFVPQGKRGEYSFNVPGRLLRNAPAKATHLVLVLDRDNRVTETNEQNNIATVADVDVAISNGVIGRLTASSRAVLKELLREAGEDRATITSLYRPPSKQAEVMFQGCLDNVKKQYALYKAAGDKVIKVFEKMTKGLTRTQILKQRKAIIAAMLKAIIKAPPYQVSHHSADPKVRQVVDVAPSSFTGFVRLPSGKIILGPAGERFLKAARQHPRVDGKTVLGPPKDPAYHLEIPQ